MANKCKRWYEQQEHLNAFVNLIEGLPEDIQCEIATEILIKTPKLSDGNYENVGEYDPKEFNRWYDKNPSIHVAIESLKDLSEEERDIVIKELSELIVKYYPEGDI